MRLSLAAVAVAALIAGPASAETCTFEVPSNPDKVYDLTPLSGRDFRVPSAKGDFEFHLSVCGPLTDPPKACDAVAKKHRVAAAQVSRGGFCFYLGRADESSVRIEDGDAELGFDLVYSSGEPCSDGRRREVRYHFICAERFEAHVAPHFVVETPEKCHYNVTWPSRYGCPVDRSAWSWWAATGRHGDPNQAAGRKGDPQQSVSGISAGSQQGGKVMKGTPAKADTAGAHAGALHPELVYGLGLPQLELWGGWTFWDVLIWSPVAAALYMVLGFAYNVRSGRSPGWGAVPHGEAVQGCLRRACPAAIARRLAVPAVAGGGMVPGSAPSSWGFGAQRARESGAAGSWSVSGLLRKLPFVGGSAGGSAGASHGVNVQARMRGVGGAPAAGPVRAGASATGDADSAARRRGGASADDGGSLLDDGVVDAAAQAGATAGGLDDAGVFGGEDDLEGLAMDGTDDLDLFQSELEADQRRAGGKLS